ncbi:amidase [Bacillaceae bacterium Marseille-Q3522]|nr:amidase [Bacillaceae bacterium Marseille-Q3522]
MSDPYQAFMSQEVTNEPSKEGNLSPLTFAVKDVFAVSGFTNSAGNPDWLRTHLPAKEHAPVLRLLAAEGARLIGMTHTDELMYSLNGENAHYGTPLNPKAPDRIPGGSSSGSAVAVAGELCDFALGTDTGGSVRIPSSYCGIFGFRPTYGAVDISGVIPLAKSFDTVGWMARDPEVLQKVGNVLLKELAKDGAAFEQLYMGEEAWNLLDDSVIEDLFQQRPFLKKITSVSFSKEGLEQWANTFRIIQGKEIWEEHGEWIRTENPYFGPGIKERFAWASTLKREENSGFLTVRKHIRKTLSGLLSTNSLLIIPTAPGAAPLKNLPAGQLEETRAKTMQLTCIAGLSGFPQITLPLFEIDGKPLGLSFIAGRHQDKRLLDFAVDFVRNGAALGFN